MFSKSIFGDTTSNTKSMINSVTYTTIPFINNEYDFTSKEYSKLNHFTENDPINELSNDYEEYIELLNILSNIEIKTKNSNTQLLLKMTRRGLINTMSVFGLNIKNIESNIKNMLLEKRINMIVSGKNEENSLVSSNKRFTLEKQFTLDPIFSYYISLFGVPEEGKGFDLKKIQIIKSVLASKNINI